MDKDVLQAFNERDRLQASLGTCFPKFLSWEEAGAIAEWAYVEIVDAVSTEREACEVVIIEFFNDEFNRYLPHDMLKDALCAAIHNRGEEG